jgi:hypothetical protein
MPLRGIKKKKAPSAYLYAVQIAPPLPFSSFELVKAQDPNRNQSQAPDDVPSETGDDGAQAKVKLTTISAAVPGLQHTGGAPAQKLHTIQRFKHAAKPFFGPSSVAGAGGS